MASLKTFWDHVASKSDDECWPWLGIINMRGYGQLCNVRGAKPRMLAAHRVAYEKSKGRIPRGLMVCHSCDNRACCNPHHLWLGTCADNHADRNRKGRQARGEKNAGAVLTERQVRAIRKSGKSYSVLAGHYGVSKGAIAFIKRGVTWRHIL